MFHLSPWSDRTWSFVQSVQCLGAKETFRTAPFWTSRFLESFGCWRDECHWKSAIDIDFCDFLSIERENSAQKHSGSSHSRPTFVFDKFDKFDIQSWQPWWADRKAYPSSLPSCTCWFCERRVITGARRSVCTKTATNFQRPGSAGGFQNDVQAVVGRLSNWLCGSPRNFAQRWSAYRTCESVQIQYVSGEAHRKGSQREKDCKCPSLKRDHWVTCDAQRKVLAFSVFNICLQLPE